MAERFNWVHESKSHGWGYDSRPLNVEAALMLGCLMRIATAMETIARRTPKTQKELEEERTEQIREQETREWMKKYAAIRLAEQPIDDAWKEKTLEVPKGILRNHTKGKEYDVLGPRRDSDETMTQSQIDERIKQIRAVDWRSPEVAAKVFKVPGSRSHAAYVEWIAQP
mgnify:CR=1 FL=1